MPALNPILDVNNYNRNIAVVHYSVIKTCFCGEKYVLKCLCLFFLWIDTNWRPPLATLTQTNIRLHTPWPGGSSCGEALVQTRCCYPHRPPKSTGCPTTQALGRQHCAPRQEAPEAPKSLLQLRGGPKLWGRRGGIRRGVRGGRARILVQEKAQA